VNLIYHKIRLTAANAYHAEHEVADQHVRKAYRL
jgi:hypothetical protein